MFWTSLGLIIASFIGYIILRMENSPDGEDSEFDRLDEVIDTEDPIQARHEERLRVVKYITFLLMGAGIALFIIYALVTV